MPPKRRASSGDSPSHAAGAPSAALNASPLRASPRPSGLPAPGAARLFGGSAVASCISPERERPPPAEAAAPGPQPRPRPASPEHHRYEQRHFEFTAGECPERDPAGAAGSSASNRHQALRYHNGPNGTERLQHHTLAHSADAEHGEIRGGKALRQPGRKTFRRRGLQSESPAEETEHHASRRGPGSRPLHDGDGVAELISPERQRPSSPPQPPRVSPTHHRYEMRHHNHVSSAECPEHPEMGDAAGGSASNDHQHKTRFHNGPTGTERQQLQLELQHSGEPEAGALRKEKALLSPGRRRLDPSPNRNGETLRESGPLIPHGLGEKIHEDEDGWAAYKEARPGGVIEVSWRRKATPADHRERVDGTAFSTFHTSMSLADVVRSGGDGNISSFNAGVPKWTEVAADDSADAAEGDGSSEPGSPRSVFSRRRAAGKGIEYGEWHREQSRLESSTRKQRAQASRPPPTPQQWLKQRIAEAKRIPAVASVLEPEDCESYLHQMTNDDLDELERRNADFARKTRQEKLAPQERRAWEFLADFAQQCIAREVARIKDRSQTEDPRSRVEAALAEALAATPAADASPTKQDMPPPTKESAAQPEAAEAPADAPTPMFDEPTGAASHVPDKVARKAMFDRMDINGNGQLRLGEIQRAVAEIYPGENLSRATLHAYRAADHNGDGLIGRREFRMLLEYLVFYCNAWAQFRAFDADEDRRLTEQEFVSGCQRLGFQITDAEAIEDFRNIDTNHGGYVLFGEFCCWAGQRHLGETKQLWPKGRTPDADVDATSMPYDDFSAEYAQETERRAARQRQIENRHYGHSGTGRHARVLSPEKSGRLGKPNKIWVANKWQDAPSVAGRLGHDQVADNSLGSPARGESGVAEVLLTSPDQQKPYHTLTSPERRTLRNRASARRSSSGSQALAPDSSVAVDLNGVWRAKGERRDGTRVEQCILLRHEQDGRVTGGHVDGINGFFVIKDGHVDGSTVLFTQEYSNGNRVLWKARIVRNQAGGASVPCLQDGTWSGANMQGSFTAVMEPRASTPAKRKPKASRRAAPPAARLAQEIDLNGRWKSEGETAGGLHSEEVLSAALPSTRKSILPQTSDRVLGRRSFIWTMIWPPVLWPARH